MNIPSLASHVLLILLMQLLLVSCSSEPETPEQIVTEFIGKLEDAAEQRNRRALKGLVSDNYLDATKRTKQDILAIANGYLLRNKSIYCFTSIDSVSQDGDTEISARVLAALGSQPITDVSMLPEIRSDIYWFDIMILRLGGSWQLAEVSWRQAMLEDFL